MSTQQDNEKIIWVRGNTQQLLIPLEKEVVSPSGDITTVDFYPDEEAVIKVILYNDYRKYEYTPSLDGNLLTITDSGTLAVGCYGVAVTVKNPDGTRLHSNWNHQVVVTATNNSVLKEWDEFKEQAIQARAAVFFFAKGDKGDPFTYEDFTPEQIEDLKKPATDAAAEVAALEQSIEAAEALRVQAEQGRVSAEEGRVTEEGKRVVAEEGRVSAEESRDTEEGKRVVVEKGRADAEALRVTAESSRADAEALRVSAEQGRALAEGTRQDNEATRQENESSRTTTFNADHLQAGTDHATAAADHTLAASDHQTAAADHTLAGTDHSTAAADHTQAGNDHTASVDATAKASNVNVTLDGMIVTITDKNGVSTSVNIGFDITKTYASVAAMNADAANVEEGTFVMIATTDTTSAENARLYVRNSNAASSSEPFTFLCDLDQAATSAWADWFNNYKPTIESDHTRAESDHGIAADDHTQAGNDHTRAESDHSIAVDDHTQAGNDHTRAEADHGIAVDDHTQAGNDHIRAESDHTRAESDHAAVEVYVDSLGAFDISAYHATGGVLAKYADLAAALGTNGANIPEALRKGGMSVKFVQSSDNKYVQFRLTAEEFSTNVEDWEESGKGDVSREDLENGTVIPALAENLASWAEDVSEVSNSWDEIIRTTAGGDPIDTSFGGVMTDIVAKSDFKCDALVTSGYNLLRLASNGGVAVAVGNGWYFPVPHLELGAFGDATKNNGVLLTDKDGNNINNATVYFKALADGVPTSVNDGVAASYQDVTYNDETFRTYLTSGAGYLIVSGITYADTCAHLAWEDWYDKYVSPTAEDDAGDSISLTALFTAAPNGTGKFLVLGSGGNTVATRATRTSSTQMTITDPIGRVTSPSWTNELQEDEETYKHSLTISDMKADGLAQIEGSDQVLTVVGTTVSYTDTNATAISGAVRYEKATAATANVTLTKTQYALNDCGIEMKSGATGEAYFGCTYSQNVADALSQIAKVKLDISLSVVAEAMLYLYNENKALQELLAGKDNAVLPVVKAQSVECDDILTMGVPNVLYSSVAGAPSAANVPDNWDEETMTVWNGCPRKIGQQYVDKVNKKVYYAVAVTGSTNDWVVLN